MKSRRKAYWIILLLLVAGAGIVFYRSPDENYHEYSEADVITRGQHVAYCLYLRGSKAPLCAEPVLEPAASAGRGSVYHELSLGEVRKRLGLSEKEVLPNDLPLFLSRATLVPELRDFRLLAFQRRNDFFVMTFGYQREGDPIISIPGKGPLLFGVALRYVRLPDSSLLSRARRKAANVPIIGAKRAGTVGRIALIDLTFNAYRSDVVEWIEQSRAQLVQEEEKARQEEMSRRSRAKDPDYLAVEKAKVESLSAASLAEAYEWAEKTMNDQLRILATYAKE